MPVRIMLLFALSIPFHFISYCQPITQTLRGRVSDEASKGPGAFASVKLLSGSETVKTTISDSAGNFKFSSVPVGRYDVEISLVGYQPEIIKELIVAAGKETFVSVYLREQSSSLEAVILKPQVNKSKPLNNMAVA